MARVVDFYSKLPKGPAVASSSSGIKARYFDGKNASGGPLVVAMLSLFAFGYTIDYNSAFIPFRGPILLLRIFADTISLSALEYVTADRILDLLLVVRY